TIRRPAPDRRTGRPRRRNPGERGDRRLPRGHGQPASRGNRPPGAGPGRRLAQPVTRSAPATQEAASSTLEAASDLGGDEGIRTPDPFDANEVRYRTALHPQDLDQISKLPGVLAPQYSVPHRSPRRFGVLVEEDVLVRAGELDDVRLPGGAFGVAAVGAHAAGAFAGPEVALAAFAGHLHGDAQDD